MSATPSALDLAVAAVLEAEAASAGTSAAAVAATAAAASANDKTALAHTHLVSAAKAHSARLAAWLAESESVVAGPVVPPVAS